MTIGNFNKYFWSTFIALLTAIMLFGLGIKGLAAMGALFGIGLAVFGIFHNRSWFICLSIPLLGLTPSLWGIDAGRLPKIFYDEILFLLLIICFCISVLPPRKKRLWTGGPVAIAVFFFFITAHSLSFFVSPITYIPLRNFCETYLIGSLLFYLFYNEIDPATIHRVIDFICGTVIILSILTIAEALARYNPIMNEMKDILYISPELAAASNGVYRPYVNFLYPSEAGTFMAMGLPFIINRAKTLNRYLGVGLIGVVLVAIAFNYTRGVWLAVGLSGFIFFKKLRKSLLVLIPLALALFILANTAFQDHPVIQRLSDATNLINRFFYWKVGMKVFWDHILIGIGHMNFEEVYLQYVRGISLDTELDIRQITVVDNTYLMTLIEHGLLGLISLLSLFSLFFVKLTSWAVKMGRKGHRQAAGLVNACLLSLTIFCLCGLLADVHLFTKATKFLFIIAGIGFAMSKADLNTDFEIKDV